MTNGLGVLKAKVGGTWVPIIGSPDEVYVGTEQPSDASIELWVDTDDPGSMSDDMRWNAAWGVVAVGSMKASVHGTVVASGTAYTDPLVFTSVTGRRYRVRVSVRAAEPNPVASSGLYSQIRKDGTLAGDAHHTYWAAVASTYAAALVEVVFVGDGTTATWDAVMYVAGGAATGYRAYTDRASSYFYIEDIGPVSGAVPAVNPTPPWIKVTTFTNGWHNRSAQFQEVRYRLFGDIVQIEGSMEGGTLGQSAFTLPVGYRPPKEMHFWAGSFMSDSASTNPPEVTITSTGTVSPGYGINAFYHLGHLQFSVTP